MRRSAGLACALWFLGVVGCGGDGGAPGEDRYARRYLPFEESWRRESEIPARPQKKPAMVIWEVSQYSPDATPSLEQRQAALDLVDRAHEAVVAHGWHDYDKAIADGFRKMPDDVRHYMKDEFLLDDRTLDPDHPEFVMYYPTPNGMVLTGMMFLVRSSEDWGPQAAGPLTVWHYHRWTRKRCYRDEVIVLGFAERGEECKAGVGKVRSPEMMHVWLIDRPGGPFATAMHLNPAKLGDLLAKRKRKRGY